MPHLEPLSFLISTDRSIGPAAIAECNKAAVEQNRSFIEGILLSMCLYFMIRVLHGRASKAIQATDDRDRAVISTA
jgi:hypothetical protein